MSMTLDGCRQLDREKRASNRGEFSFSTRQYLPFYRSFDSFSSTILHLPLSIFCLAVNINLKLSFGVYVGILFLLPAPSEIPKRLNGDESDADVLAVDIINLESS